MAGECPGNIVLGGWPTAVLKMRGESAPILEMTHKLKWDAPVAEYISPSETHKDIHPRRGAALP